MANKATIRQTRYDLTHCRTYGLKLNLETDSDVIAKLATVDSMQGYIKQLIREDIARTCSAPDSISDSVPKKRMSLNDLYRFLEQYTGDYDDSMYELLNALVDKHMNK